MFLASTLLSLLISLRWKPSLLLQTSSSYLPGFALPIFGFYTSYEKVRSQHRVSLDSFTCVNMPSIAQTALPPISSKKRRRDDEAQMKISSPRLSYHALLHNADTLMDKENHVRPMHPKPLKRQRFESTQSQDLCRPREISDRPEERGVAKIDLRPCHICRRKPSDKQQLADYANCEGCGERTCFICIRQCEGFDHERGDTVDVEGDYDILASSFGRGEEGMDGADGDGQKDQDMKSDGGGVWEKGRMTEHRRTVCRQCSVELGVDGDVRCLGCFRAEAAT
ncbi:hypothetical protein B0O99DRAFT_627557 [Bisporella sp. PMI_857]|nr:hypothetical protein B0O99DRAFT_627557 [Bisporella sp. PMI_857]